eukprot:Blabericola_migrator_1__7414@NODE_377_length_9219_cov_163_315122_g301_i0_p3_GENE_NODE_377_length_9219_cov_163_315122_g301_i0NODE_377_length_9219_cov_163_315122_g301_i0_p3_ORF_typecomplete_len330_score49_49Antiterm/PF03589_13/1_2e03Antiterm/PF03589_13/4_2e03Antiterm/PF03589_13/1_8_NODE_377_length_9219_cov_163_315122_g301_i03411330
MMYQRALNEISAEGLAQSKAAHKVNTLIHGISGSEHPHQDTFKALFHSSAHNQPEQLRDSSATADFGRSQDVSQHVTPSTAGALIPTGAEVNSLYRGPQQPIMSSSAYSLTGSGMMPGSSGNFPMMSSTLGPVRQVSVQQPQFVSQYAPVQPSTYTTGTVRPSPLLQPSGVPSTSHLSVPQPHTQQHTHHHIQQHTHQHTQQVPQPYTSYTPSTPTITPHVQLPAGTSVMAPRPALASQTMYQTQQYSYAPIGQSSLAMPHTPVSTPMIRAPGLTPMGRDLEARSSSTGAPVTFSKHEVQSLQKQAAKEASKSEKRAPKPEKKKKGCCK